VAGSAATGALAKAVILIARSLGLRVAAEGVEQPEQLDFLREHACDLAQGYLFSPPLSGPEITDYLSTHGFDVAARVATR